MSDNYDGPVMAHQIRRLQAREKELESSLITERSLSEAHLQNLADAQAESQCMKQNWHDSKARVKELETELKFQGECSDLLEKQYGEKLTEVLNLRKVVDAARALSNVTTQTALYMKPTEHADLMRLIEALRELYGVTTNGSRK